MLRAADVLQGTCFAVCHSSRPAHEKRARRPDCVIEMGYTVGKDGVVRPYDGPKLMSKLIRMQNSLDNDLKRPPRYRRLVTPRAKDEDKEPSLVPRPESPLSEDTFSLSLVRASSPEPTPLKPAHEPSAKIR